MTRSLRRVLAAACAMAAFATTARAQQPATVTGVVTSEAGAPLASAGVYVAGLNLGTITRGDGQYRLVIPAARFRTGQVLQLSAQILGYRTRTANITVVQGATQRQDFELALDPLRLEEIVATGAGTQQRAIRLGNARASVDSSIIVRANEVNVVQALAGRVAGVVTNQQGGEAGASTSILIRGSKSLTGTGQPLLVVDGVPINNATRITGSSILQGGVAPNRGADVNPDDIESVEILKGPAASSIYGASAGTGGAILITTKRGKPGQTSYTLHSSSQFDKPTRTVPLQRMYGVGYKDPKTGNDVSSACPPTTVNCFLSGNFFSWGPRVPAGTPTYDHAAELYETGHMFDNTLSISGGSERTTFYLSLGATNQNGYIVGKNDAYNRYSVRFNGTHQLFDNLTVSASGNYIQTAGSFIERGNTVNGLLLGALRTPPDFNNQQYLDPTTGLHRTYRFPNPGPTAVLNNRGFDNPFYAINSDKNLGQVGRFFGNVNVKWTPLQWLTVNYTAGADYASDDRTEAYAVSSSGAAAGGTVERWQFYDRTLDHNLVATATHTFGHGITGDMTFGQNLRENYFRQVDVLGRTLIAPQPFKLANTVTTDPPTDAETRTRLAGYLGQANLAFGDELFVGGGVRNDASSTFGLKKNNAWYPRANLAWVFNKRARLPEGIIDFAKFRLAYGQSGQTPGAYQLQDIFNGSTSPFIDFNPGATLIPTLGGIGGLYSARGKGNPDIRPERNTEIETGLDLTLLHNRADLALTYYDQDARDLIYSVPLAPSTGFTSVPKNSARITNKGIEANLNVRPVMRRDWGLDLGLTWSRNRNHVVSLGDTLVQVVGISSSFTGSTTNAQVGHANGVFRGLDFARCGRGLTKLGVDDIAAACQGQPDGALYIGANGFPIQDPNTQVIGDPNPDWTGGLNAELRIRGVHITTFVEHRNGGGTLDMTRASLLQFGTAKETEIRGQQRTFGKDYYKGAVVGPGAGSAVLIDQNWFTGLGGNNGPKAQFMEDATFTRLREVAIAYTFRQDWLQRVAGVNSVDARIAGRNLKTWTNYMGFDPEPNLAGAAAGNRGIDWFVNPLSRSVALSLSIHR